MVNHQPILNGDPQYLNALDLVTEIEWFGKVLDTRLKLHFGEECPYQNIYEIDAPDLNGQESVFYRILSAFISYPLTSV